MEDVVPFRIQVVSIIGSIGFLYIIARLILRGRLREEYAVIWLISTFLLLLFSFWRDGLRTVANILGVYYAPSLIFLAAIFAIAVFLVHISLVVSRLQSQIREISQTVALLHETKTNAESEGEVSGSNSTKDA